MERLTCHIRDVDPYCGMKTGFETRFEDAPYHEDLVSCFSGSVGAFNRGREYIVCLNRRIVD